MGFAKYTTKLGSGLTGPSFFYPRDGYLGLLRMYSSSAGHAGRSASPTNLKAVTTIKQLGQKDKAPDFFSQACHALFRHELRQNMVPFLKVNSIAPQKVFVSYSWANSTYSDVTSLDSQLLEQNAVQQCAEDLLYANIDVWIDVNKARLGDPLADDGFDSRSDINIIKDNIDASDAVLIMGTPVYLAKYSASHKLERTHMVYDEVEYIRNVRDKKSIIPAFLGVSAHECIPRFLLEGRRVELDFGESEDYFRQAFRLIRDIYGIPHHQEDYKKIVDNFFVSMNGLLAFEPESVGLARKLRHYQNSIDSVEEVANMLAYNKGSRAYKSSNANVVLFNSPYVNPYFIRRTKLYDKLDETVEQYPSSYDGQPKVLAVFGLGGSGKSQFAADFFLRNAKGYDFALWIESESYRSVISAYRQFLQKHLDVAARERLTGSLLALSDKEVIELFRDFVAGSGKVLIVYDNAYSYRQFEVLLPQWGEHLIMATTRLNDWPECGHVEVKGMESDEAVTLMRKITKIKDQAENLYLLAETLGYLPLAIAQASAYIDSEKIVASDYLALYQKNRAALLKSSVMPKGLANKHEPVWVTWDINMGQVRSLMPGAEDLLKLMCFFSSNNISRELIEESEHGLKEFKKNFRKLIIRKNMAYPFWLTLFATGLNGFDIQKGFDDIENIVYVLFLLVGVNPIGNWINDYFGASIFALPFFFPSALNDEMLVKALHLLTKYSLISSDDYFNNFSVHSLVQATIRSKLDNISLFKPQKHPFFFYIAALCGSNVYVKAIQDNDDELMALYFLDHVEALLFIGNEAKLHFDGIAGFTFTIHLDMRRQVNLSLAYLIDQYFEVCKSFSLDKRVKRFVDEFSQVKKANVYLDIHLLRVPFLQEIVALHQVHYYLCQEHSDFNYKQAQAVLNRVRHGIGRDNLKRLPWEDDVLESRMQSLEHEIQRHSSYGFHARKSMQNR